MNRRWIVLAAPLALISLVSIGMDRGTSAHGGSDHTARGQVAPAVRAAQTTAVMFGGALGFVYSPQHTFILPGDSIRWQGDFTSHPLVSEDGLWQQVSSGSEFTFTFDQPGSYGFHCFFHDTLGMNGTVTVATTYFLPLLVK